MARLRLLLYPYRYADAVLEHSIFKSAYDDFVDILKAAPVPLLDPKNPNPRTGGVKHRKRKPLKDKRDPRYFFLPVDQKKLNSYFDRALTPEHDWELHPPVVPEGSISGPKTGLEADFKRGKLQVEIQFGNMARWYTDVFKFQLSYSLGAIDVAVLVVPTQKFANFIDENVAYFERVIRELPHAKMSLTLPILVIGVEPMDFRHIEHCYNEAAVTLREHLAKDRKSMQLIPFKDRLAEHPLESLDNDTE